MGRIARIVAASVADRAWLAERIAGWVCGWGEYLGHEDEDGLGAKLRRAESTGRPLGNDGCAESIGRRLGRDLLPKKRGPKLKPKPANVNRPES